MPVSILMTVVLPAPLAQRPKISPWGTLEAHRVSGAEIPEHPGRPRASMAGALVWA